MAKIKSARGQILDTDLFKIKQQLNSGKTDQTIKRENYVNDRRRRSSSRRISEMLANEQMVKQKLEEQKVSKFSEEIDAFHHDEIQSTESQHSLESLSTAEEPVVETTRQSKPSVTPRIIKKQG